MAAPATPPKSAAGQQWGALMRAARGAGGGGALRRAESELKDLEGEEQKLLDGLPAAEGRVRRAKAAVVDTEQTLAIAKDRLVLARRAAEDAESEGDGGRPGLLRAEGAALEDEQRVADELQREQGRLREAEGEAAKAPAIARLLARRRKEVVGMRERWEMRQQLHEAQTLEANRNFAA